MSQERQDSGGEVRLEKASKMHSREGRNPELLLGEVGHSEHFRKIRAAWRKTWRESE
jgi:hypothetical protein